MECGIEQESEDEEWLLKYAGLIGYSLLTDSESTNRLVWSVFGCCTVILYVIDNPAGREGSHDGECGTHRIFGIRCIHGLVM